jgi:excisionase family DNA binding protein
MKVIEGPYFDVHGVAKHVGCSRVTIYRLIKRKNGIPCHRVGGSWRFIKDEIEKWVKERK